MKLWGLPTTNHALVLLKNACRTCNLPGHFALAGLKMGCPTGIFEQNSNFFWLEDLSSKLHWENPEKNLFINRHLLLHKQQQARISLMREKGPWWILNSHWIIHRWVPKSQSSTNRAPTTSLVQRMAEAA